MVVEKRIEEGIQNRENPAGRAFMELAQKLHLGVADKERIELIELKVES
jgi:hypothetical protein